MLLQSGDAGGEAEVPQLDVSRGSQEHIFGLDVPVDDGEVVLPRSLQVTRGLEISSRVGTSLRS